MPTKKKAKKAKKAKTKKATPPAEPEGCTSKHGPFCCRLESPHKGQQHRDRHPSGQGLVFWD